MRPEPKGLVELCGLGSIGRSLVTLAPELDIKGDLIRYLAGRNVRVSAGHTNATYAEIQRAMEQGLSSVTHLFNAMRPFHHRDPIEVLKMHQTAAVPPLPDYVPSSVARVVMACLEKEPSRRPARSTAWALISCTPIQSAARLSAKGTKPSAGGT